MGLSYCGSHSLQTTSHPQALLPLASMHNGLGYTLLQYPTSQALPTSPAPYQRVFVCEGCTGTTQPGFACRWQAFRQKSGIFGALFLPESVEKKLCQVWFSIVASVVEIWKPDIISALKRAFPGVFGDFLCVVILAETKGLELTTDNLLTCLHP